MACGISPVVFALPQRLQLRYEYDIKVSLAFSSVFSPHKESMIIYTVVHRLFSDCLVSSLECWLYWEKCLYLLNFSSRWSDDFMQRGSQLIRYIQTLPLHIRPEVWNPAGISFVYSPGLTCPARDVIDPWIRWTLWHGFVNATDSANE